MRILIVDDAEAMRAFLRAMLSRSYDIVGEAENGKIAVEHVHELKPDLVLLDIEMPVMNGIECCRRIKTTNPETIVIIVTSRDNEDKIDEAFQAGCDDYFTKPITGPELLKKIEGAIDVVHA